MTEQDAIEAAAREAGGDGARILAKLNELGFHVVKAPAIRPGDAPAAQDWRKRAFERSPPPSPRIDEE